MMMRIFQNVQSIESGYMRRRKEEEEEEMGYQGAIAN
jgi:hypothetical protein